MGNWPESLYPDWELDDLVRARFAAVEAAIVGDSVLDVGCRDGTFLMGLDIPLRSRFGVDIDEANVIAANRASKDANGIAFMEADILNPALALGLWDTVVCMETIEHLEADPTVVIRKLMGFVKPGGRLIITVPANSHISDEGHVHTFYREVLLKQFPKLHWLKGIPHIWLGFFLEKEDEL